MVPLFFFLLISAYTRTQLPTKLLKVWKKPKRVHMDFINIMKVGCEQEEDGDDDGDGDEDGSLIRRKKRCTDIHKLIKENTDVGR